MRVVVLMRKPSPTLFSMERVFETVVPRLPVDVEYEVVNLPAGHGLGGRLRNLLFTSRLRADVVHVTGDVHYCVLAVRRAVCVLTVHDLVSLHRLTGARRWLFELIWYRLPIRRADLVTTISGAVFEELLAGFAAARAVRESASATRSCAAESPPRSRS